MGQAIGVKKQPLQITSRFQPFHATDIPGRGIQVDQTEQVLLGQRSVGLFQSLADGGVQAGIGDLHFLRQGRGHKTGQDQQGQNERSDEGNDGFHVNGNPAFSWPPLRLPAPLRDR